MDIGKTLYVWERQRWRAWLEQHHASEPEIWLVFYTMASGKPSLAYDDAVEEALCFGWIDSIVKKHGPQSRAQRFTPRRRGSRLSEMNMERVRRLRAAGLMSEAGLAVVGDVLDLPFEVPADILEVLQADATAWVHFQAFPESYRRIRVGWIDGSRSRRDVFEQRLAYFLRMTRQNKRFGSVQ
jgi:uncharacterized protein YdeI (YjbR/CyaY-like superfamily)